MAIIDKSRFDALNDLVVFCNSGNHSEEAILEYLVRKTFAEYEVTAAFIARSTMQRRIMIGAHYGVDPQFWMHHPMNISLDDSLPLCEAFRSNHSIFLSKANIKRMYLEFMETLRSKLSINYFACVNIASFDVTHTSVVLLSRWNSRMGKEFEIFCQVCINVCAPRLGIQDVTSSMLKPHSFDRTGNEFIDYRDVLTERQQVILTLMAEDRTNASISQVLGYSESTIRQETIRIYAKLHCSGRQEAIERFTAIASSHRGDVVV